MASDIDVLIIGSGFGGSVVASRLAEAGKNVVVLERGPWRETLPVTSAGIENTHPLPRASRRIRDIVRTIHAKGLPKKGLTLNKKGHLEVRNHGNLVTMAASGVGGGSHAWGGLLTRPADENYWNLTEELSTEVMRPHYERVEQELGAKRLKPEWGHLNFPPEKNVAKDSCFISVETNEHPAMAYLLPEVVGGPEPVTDSNGIARKPTDYSGQDGLFGSPTGSKTSVDAIYLLPALKKGLKVMDMHEAESFTHDNSGFIIVVKNLNTGRKEKIRAKKLVLAAGTMNTVTLMFRSQAKGLAKVSPCLGKGFGTNGDYPAIWNLGNEKLDSVKGLNVHGKVKIENASGNYNMILGAMEMPPVGPFLSRLIANSMEADRRKYMLIGMGADEQLGHFSFKNGKLGIHYDTDKSQVFKDIKADLEKVSAASGCSITPQMAKTATVHAFGGCRIGCTSEEGVVDGTGNVFGVPNLFIADASVFPIGIGNPPSLSIAAWASHVSDSLVVD